MLHGILRKIDSSICSYLGLEKEEVTPTSVEMINGTLYVTNTSSFRRHLTQESWNDFSSVNIKQTNTENQEKLGLAIGKALASNLIVTFEKPDIRR